MPRTTFRNDLLPGSLRRHAQYWQELETVHDLSALLRVPQHQLQLISLRPAYKTYEIPKRDGSARLIEDPAPALKAVQRKLNHFLQATYYFQRPTSVHGFCIRPRHTEARNILSNAQAHLAQPHLLNLDLEDFFHLVSLDRVQSILETHFPAMQPTLVELIGRLSTRWGRLPMGAPTSPVFSNWACLPLDAAYESLAKNMGWVYTRFADDLSFSSRTAIGSEGEEMLRGIAIGEGWKINEEKRRRFGPGEVKIVTGLHLQAAQIGLPPGYLENLQTEIARLQAVKATEYRYRMGLSRRKIKRFEQELKGKLNFAAQVLGGDSPLLQEPAAQLESAGQPPERFEAVDWLDIPY